MNIKLSFLFICTVLCCTQLFGPPITDIFLAIEFNHDVDKFITEANANSVQQGGTTPLMMVSASRGLEKFGYVEKLLKAGAKVNTQDNNGATAYDFALHSNQINIAKKLRDAGGKSGIDL